MKTYSIFVQERERPFIFPAVFAGIEAEDTGELGAGRAIFHIEGDVNKRFMLDVYNITAILEEPYDEKAFDDAVERTLEEEISDALPNVD